MRTAVHKILMFSLLMSWVFTSANTQTTQRVKNRAEQKANQRVDQKVDEAVDKTFDKIEGLFKKKKNKKSTETTSQEAGHNEQTNTTEEEQNAGDFLGGLSFGGGDFEAYENPMRLNLSMDFTFTKSNGKSNASTMLYTLDTWQTAMEMNHDGNDVRILLDNKEGYMTMITTTDGETQAFRMRQRTVDMADVMPDESNYEITATGNTRVIDGYNCKEYIIKHEEGTTTTWTTDEVKGLDMQALARSFASISSQQKNMKQQKYFDIGGVPIEATTVSNNGKETTTIHYYGFKTGNDVSLDAFDTSGVEVMNLGF